MTPGPMVGDYNNNGVVDAADFTVWRDNLGSTNPIADGDGDGIVDIDDYVIWTHNFGNVVTAVPEPPGTWISLTGLFVFCLHFRKNSIAGI